MNDLEARNDDQVPALRRAVADLLERVDDIGAKTQWQVTRAAHQLGVSSELDQLRQLMIVARHVFVFGLTIPADEWRVLHPPLCEPIKSICPYELARHVRTDGMKTIGGKRGAMFWVTLDPGDPTVEGGDTLVVGDRVDPADIPGASGTAPTE
jgi:hypothetical protein